MGHGGGGRINKPKSSVSDDFYDLAITPTVCVVFSMQLCKKDLRKERKLKVKSLKRLAEKGRSDETLGDTTVDILRQCRCVCVCVCVCPS